MPVVTQYAPNTFYCPGLCSGDAAKSKAFYQGLLAWEPVDMEGYTTFKVSGAMAAGMYQMADDRKAAGVKPHWNNYMCVADIKKICEDTEKLGGKVLTEPFDAEGSLMANLQDPTGIKFSVWQEVSKSQEPTVAQEPGTLCWTELCSPDAKTSEEFYTKLLGWTAKPFDGSPMPYTIFSQPGAENGVAGMLQITPEMQGLEPQWLPYFLVEDADKTAARANELGGHGSCIIDIPTVGRIGMLADAEGAPFAVIKPAAM